MSQSSHLKIGSKDTNDLNIFLNNAETLQITRSGTEVRYQSNSGSGTHRFMNTIQTNGNLVVAGSVFNIANIPTSASGLATGDIWSNSGVLTIV